MRFVKRSRIAAEPDRETAERERRRERIIHSFGSIYYGNVKMFYVTETEREGEEGKNGGKRWLSFRKLAYIRALDFAPHPFACSKRSRIRWRALHLIRSR